MRRILVVLVSCLCMGSVFAQLDPVPAPPPPPDPAQFLGFTPGADRKLADYHQIVRYLDLLDKASDRIQVHRLGKTTLGNDMVMAAISSPRNIERSFEYRDMAHRLADPRGIPKDEIERIIRDGQVILLITCNIHSTEIAASQMAMELAWTLATTQDARLLGQLQNVILLLVPSLNPDGQIMEVEWYDKYIGTPFEGGRMPWLYHHYAGHDNNRDFFMLSLAETRMINQVLHHDWFPQIYLDEHQMGSTGPRLFVPPFADPLNGNIPPLIWRMTDLIGTEMALREQQAGRTGVIDSYAFDGYWPGGSMNTAWWKNVVGVLTEMASAKMATPIFVDGNELAGSRKGLPEYQARMNFPDPWKGGWWHLRDIIDYEMTVSLSILRTASEHREDFLRGMADMAAGQVREGAGSPPYAWVIPPGQHDPPEAARLVEILREGGVEAHQSNAALTLSGRVWPAGSVFFLMDQPYRSFLKEMMERQVYPDIRPSEDAAIYRPYDVTGWTLPLQMGVRAVALDDPIPVPARESMVLLSGPVAPEPRSVVVEGGDDPGARWYAIEHRTNNASIAINRLLRAGRAVYLASEPFSVRVAGGIRRFPAGTILVGSDTAPDRAVSAVVADLGTGAVALSADAFEQGAPNARRLATPRLGLYKPWAASIDEGWTRLVLERSEFGYEGVDNAAIRNGGLRSRFDVIILPDIEPDVIVDGKHSAKDGESRYFVPLPDEYAGGIGAEGVKALEQFVRDGGTLVTLDSSSLLPIREFGIPVRNTLETIGRDRFSCPGGLLEIALDPNHPVAYGMPETSAAYFAQGPAFATMVPGSGQDRAVIARFPDGPLLMSGWIQGEELLRRRAAAVEVTLGKGRIILFGLRIQHRSQTHATYKLLFNSIHYGASEPVARLAAP